MQRPTLPNANFHDTKEAADMNRIRQGWDALRRGRRSGVSLVIALCAVAVLIGLSLSIVCIVKTDCIDKLSACDAGA